jgi:AcrR family transcriptional regulator
MSVSEARVSSGQGTAKSRGRTETRRRLVEAGTELFAQHGLHGTTSAQISQRAGVATGTFYLHFKDKQSLFREIAFDALARLRARQDRASEAAGPRGTRVELRARNEELLRFAHENGNLIRAVFGRGAAGSEIGDELLDAIVPDVEGRLREAVAGAPSLPGLHPAAAAQALTALVLRLVVWWIDHPDLATREQVVDTILRMHPVLAGRPADS